MQYVEQVAFLLVAGVAAYFLTKRIGRIRQNILLGRKQAITDNKALRWKTMALVALGQKKMFKRLIPALLHLMIYVGFLVINLEVLEFVIDGIAGTHRVLLPVLGEPLYNLSMNVFEFLAVAVLFSCIVFLIRRNVLKVGRFHKPEMKKWPTLDANLILVIEIVLMCAVLTMNATDQLLQGREGELAAHYAHAHTGKIVFSALVIPLFEGMGTGTLVFVERFAWWFHIIGILGFAVYVTYSKHLHIFMAFPNTYFSRLQAKGHMQNMKEVTAEVADMMQMEVPGITDQAPAEAPEAQGEEQDIPTLGAKDINDLSWKNLMEAYACTECGRCTSECPANLTGKALSPRKIMMDTRDRMEDVGNSLAKGGEGLNDGKLLLGDYITKEEINACTTCNACVEACPVNISPLDIILQLRRYVALEESGSPASWNSMFSNVENNFAPWKFPPTDRFNWAEKVND